MKATVLKPQCFIRKFPKIDEPFRSSNTWTAVNKVLFLENFKIFYGNFIAPSRDGNAYTRKTSVPVFFINNNLCKNVDSPKRRIMRRPIKFYYAVNRLKSAFIKLKASLEEHPNLKLKKRTNPTADAKFWCDSGLDKDGFERKFISDKVGYGLFASRQFENGEFLLEYVGERISPKIAEGREKVYAKQDSKLYPRCYIYHFKFNGKEHCIDATKTKGRLCQFANDASNGEPTCNAKMKLKVFDGYPRLCLFATNNIEKGIEIRYDYGEDGGKLPWREKERQTNEDITESDSDENPFGLPDSTEEQSSELDENTEVSEECENIDTDMSDAKDPSYKLPETYSETSCSSYSDIIPNTDSSIMSGCTFGAFLGKKMRGTNKNRFLKTTACQQKNQDKPEDTVVSGENYDGEVYPESQDQPEDTVFPGVKYDGETNPESQDQLEDTVVPGENYNGEGYPESQDQPKDTVVPGVNYDGEANPASTESQDQLEDTVVPGENYDGEGYPESQDQPEDTVVPGVNYDGEANPESQDQSEDTVAPGENYIGEANPEIQDKPEDTAVSGENNDNKAYPDNQDKPENTLLSGDNNDCEAYPGHVCSNCKKCFKTRGALVTHMKKHETLTEEEYKRPPRVCPFCDDLRQHTQLPRHIELRHKKIPAVAEACDLPKHSKERTAAFTAFRKEGILRHNKFQAQLPNPKYMSERKNQEDLVCCSKCKGFYGRKLFHRHKSTCTGDSAFQPVSLHMDSFKTFSNGEDEQFSKVILSRFQRDDIGNFCRSDRTMNIIGRRLFQKLKRKPDNVSDTKKGVMNDMRLIAKLFMKVKEHGQCEAVEDMFLRHNFSSLETAIDIVTKDDTANLKYGVKHHIQYLLLTVHDILVGHLYGMGKDEKASEMEKWKKLFELNKTLIFGDSTYAINMSRQEKLRMPEQIAEEEEVNKLRDYISGTIQKCTSDFTFFGPHEFVLLRDSICSRLTLFNARRGGEPPRLTLQHYRDAKSGRWIQNKKVENMDTVDKQLFKTMDITYQPGKGNHLVSDFIPNDCKKGLDLLIDPDVRRRSGVAPENRFIFANTQGSDTHVQGWDAINRMCEGAKVKNPNLLTATMQRHRISTIYSAMDVPESERDFFYKHMGHSKAVNVGTYQYPLPIMAVTKVGKHLQAIDKASSSATATCTATRAESEEHDIGQTAGSQNIEMIDALEPQAGSGFSLVQAPTGQLNEGHEVPNDDSTFSSVQTSSQPDSEYIAVRRDYFKWTDEETRQINVDFNEWITAADGNALPSKNVLIQYMANRMCRYTYRQLRSKIMNEQNKQQRRANKRMGQMRENN